MSIKERLIFQLENTDFAREFITDLRTEKTYSYGHFFEKCIRLSQILDEYDTYDGVVAIMDNSLLLVELYFAVILSGKRIYTIDPIKGEKEIEEIVSELSNALLIRDNNVKIEHIEELEEITNSIFQIEECNLSCKEVQELVLEKFEQRDFTNEYLITYTSGTTGKAKGVRHSLNNLFGTAYAFLGKVQTPGGNKFLHTMPMTYMAGILNSIFFPFVANLHIILDSRFSVKTALRFWNVVEANEITVFWLSPAMLIMIEQVDRKGIGREYCKNHDMHFYIGTAALTDKTRDNFERKYGVNLLASYGLSETLFISVQTGNIIASIGKSNVGELLSDVEYRISDDGELCLKVPWMFLGYTNVNTEQFFDEGYYKSGDIAELRNGALYITGRKKDLIVRGGMNISPAKIETLINTEKEIKECVVFGAKNKFEEEQICCAYVLDSFNRGIEQIESNIEKKICNALGRNYHIDFFVSLKELPRNINGKIDKKALIEIVEKTLKTDRNV